MIELCCDDFKFAIMQGFIWYEKEKKPKIHSYKTEPGGIEIMNPTWSGSYRCVMESLDKFIKVKGEFTKLKWDTFLEYCPRCGKKLTNDQQEANNERIM